MAESVDHDLLIKLDTKVDFIIQQVDKKADIDQVNQFKHELKEMILMKFNSLSSESMGHGNQIIDHEKRIKSVETKIDKVVGGCAVVGFLWTIIWIVIQKYSF